jgi:hypothetical protein
MIKAGETRNRKNVPQHNSQPTSCYMGKNWNNFL